MSLTDPETIEKLLGFENDQEREAFEAERLQLDILHVVSQRMERDGLTKSDLAAGLGVSKSYVSQLFSVDKPLNLRMLAKIERLLGARFRIGLADRVTEPSYVDGWAGSKEEKVANVIPFLHGGAAILPRDVRFEEPDMTQEVG